MNFNPIKAFHDNIFLYIVECFLYVLQIINNYQKQE